MDGIVNLAIGGSLDSDSKLEKLVVITGQGHGSGPEGPVLQERVPIFLEERGLKTVPQKGNAGAFLLTRKTLRTWAKQKKLLTKDGCLVSALRRPCEKWTPEDRALIDSVFQARTRKK
jgi:hypothetical protein